MAKMFYKTEEAAAKLSVSVDQLKDLVTQNKLREFRDGANVMFKVDQVDRLANDMKPAGKTGDSAIGLAPVDSGSHDALSLADADPKPPVATKDDTVVTGGSKAGAPGASGKAMVFDETEIKPADSSAQTQIQPAVDDQLSLEGVGSGSGLLDLTRESDDTSLGAELLDEIYPGSEQKTEGGIGSASGIFDQPVPPEGGLEASGLSHAAESSPAAVMSPVDFVEENDPSSGAFGGLALAAVIAMGVTVLILSSFSMGFRPEWVDLIMGDSTKLALFGGILAIIAALFAGVGFFVGKATAR
jgi:hypothetical protein